MMVAVAICAGAIAIGWTLAVTARELGARAALSMGVLSLCIAALAVAPVLFHALTVAHAGFLVCCATLCCAVALIDARERLIPDLLLLPLATAAAASPLTETVQDKALGAFLLGVVFLLTRQSHYALRGKEGMGLGDVKFAVVIGAMTGPALGLWVVVIASALTAGFIVFRRGRSDAPFGVGLAMSTIAAIAIGLPWGAP